MLKINENEKLFDVINANVHAIHEKINSNDLFNVNVKNNEFQLNYLNFQFNTKTQKNVKTLHDYLIYQIVLINYITKNNISNNDLNTFIEYDCEYTNRVAHLTNDFKPQHAKTQFKIDKFNMTSINELKSLLKQITNDNDEHINKQIQRAYNHFINYQI